MVLGNIIGKLESSKIFIEWHNQNTSYYLVHAFVMIDPKVKQDWQIGYYDKEKDNIVTFDVGKKIVQNPESEVFKKSGIVNKLDLNKVKVDFNKALKISENFVKKHYPAYAISKKIFILQNLEKLLWNITFISGSFETLNIKIDAVEGKVVFHNLTKIFSFETSLKSNSNS